jgi:hypothetical protein
MGVQEENGLSPPRSRLARPVSLPTEDKEVAKRGCEKPLCWNFTLGPNSASNQLSKPIM